MLYIKEAFNYMRKQLHDIRCNCACLVCAKIPDSSCLACDQVYSGVTQLWESLLCNKGEDSAFHEKKCILGTCCKCGTKKLRLCPHEEGNTSLLVPVKVFEECPRQTRSTHEANNDGARETSCDPRADNDGARGTRKDLKVVHMKCPDFISFMKTKIGSFIVHNFIYRWQAQQYKDCLTGFPDDVVVSVIDFAENYTFKEQNEIQSMHWYNDQVTILVHINYVRVNRVVKKTYHFYISDDKTHDTMFVQHCLLLHDSWLKDQGYELKRHWIWSDGCAAQFKARRPFYFVARFFSITGLEMLWSFPCSGHGKGEHDGAGAVIKRELTHEQLKPNGCTLKCAADCVTFLRDKFSSNDVQRVFWEIKEGEVSRENTWDCKRIVKSRSMHSVNGYSATDTLAIRCRSLSCFCDECMDGRWGRCKNKRYVASWEYRSIVPLTEVAASDSDESDKDEGNAPLYAGHPDVLSDVLAVGDNFAVNADEGADFFVIKCTTAKTRIGSARQDNWGNVLTARAMVVSGYYYERVEGNVWRLLVDRPPVLMYSHLVRAIKFEMDPIPGEASLYTMDEEVEENIYNSMPFDL